MFDCVTVGSGRPSPALLVEPTEHVERDAIPRIIIERLSAFNHSRLPHERLDDPRLVLVVKRGALPRTVVSDNLDSLSWLTFTRPKGMYDDKDQKMCSRTN